MATQSTLKNLKTDEVFADYSRNFRMSSAYTELKPIDKFDPEKNKPGLYEDIDANGLHTPLWVAELSDAEAEKVFQKTGGRFKYRVIRGHRRFHVVSAIRERSPERFKTVDCQVFKGLTDADEYRLMADHMQTKGLNDFEIYQAIKTLAVNTRLSEEQIGSQMGVSRGYVQRRKWIAAMPSVVETEFRKRFERDDEGKAVPCVKFNDKQLNELNKAFNLDKNASPPVDSDSPGSAFAAEWDKVVAGNTGEKELKSLTRKEIQDKMSLVKDPILRIVLAFCSGDPVNLGDAVDQIEVLRDNLRTASNDLMNAQIDLRTANDRLKADVTVSEPAENVTM
jgi:hypothetical protein